MFGGGDEEETFPTLKVLRQYSLVLLVKVRCREGKALGEKLSMSCVRPEYRPSERTTLGFNFGFVGTAEV